MAFGGAPAPTGFLLLKDNAHTISFFFFSMPSPRIPIHLNSEMYFLTFTIKDWSHILDRYDRWNMLLDSLQYCITNKELRVFAWVFMKNHIHLIVKSPDVSGFVRDFKKHTAHELMQSMKKNEPDLIELFKEKDKKYRIWEKTNMPKLIETEEFFLQKKEYIEHRTYP